jgi:hypothetical protein
MQITPMTVAWGYRHQLPYKRKLLLITAPGDPKNEELRSTVKHVMSNLLEPVEFKEIDFNKHPNIGKKLGLKMIKQYEIIDKKQVEVEPALPLPQLVFLEDDVVCYQKQGIVRPYTLWAAMTRKPVYGQPADDIVPVNPFG